MVRKRVGKQPRQPAERLARQRRELEDALPARHRRRRHVPSRAQELRRVLEGRGCTAISHTDCANRASPELDFGGCHAGPPLRPRMRRPFSSRKSSIGVGPLAGTSWFTPPSSPSARRTRKNNTVCTETPTSILSTVRFETPASYARSACRHCRARRRAAMRAPSSTRAASSVQLSSMPPALDRLTRRIIPEFSDNSPD